MWIERKILKELEISSGQYPALVVTGARQTGKTSLLRHIFPKADYVTLDYPIEAAEADQDGDNFLSRHKEPLIIDEVQYAPNLFRFLKIAIDKDRRNYGRYLLTGSQRFPLMKHVSESLAGRIAILELLTLSHEELELAFSQISEGDLLVDWILRGGYPELYAESKDAERFFGSYIASYIERDVRSLINIKSARDFDRFLRLVASRTGQLISYASLANDLGLSGPTIKDWIHVLEASHVVQIIEPWFTNDGKRIIKTP
ncbi:MAG: AAA family ATPase, partial [Proteobacteria bacterium]|nr:AAA family ATPase [Pseudomonadota bacterium]